MRLRRVVLGLLVVWGVFATAAVRNCGRQTRVPANPPLLSSSDPSEVTQAYWLTAHRVCVESDRAVISRDELRRKVEGVRSPADGRRVWAELAESYARSADVKTGAVRDLNALPRDRADPVAVECVAGLADFLTQQAELFRRSGEQCAEMGSLFALIDAEGEGFDWDSPKGREYERREADLMARMKQTVVNEGASEKRRLEELAASTKATGTTLAKKHGRQFPDLLGK